MTKLILLDETMRGVVPSLPCRLEEELGKEKNKADKTKAKPKEPRKYIWLAIHQVR